MLRSQKQATLTPIIVALMILASVGLLGVVVAIWPAEPDGPQTNIRFSNASGQPQAGGEFEPLVREERARDVIALPPCRSRCSRWM
jgi:hypothetical protein